MIFMTSIEIGFWGYRRVGTVVTVPLIPLNILLLLMAFRSMKLNYEPDELFKNCISIVIIFLSFIIL